jgi:hypothetical protein
MNNLDKQHLLRDTIEDEDYQQFRARLKQRLLADFRHRKGPRHTAWLLALAACLAMSLTVLLLQRHEPAGSSKPVAITTVIRTIRLAPDHRIKSVSAPAFLVVSTKPNSPIFSPGASFAIVRTTATFGNSLYLSDEELLALFPDKPVGLVSTPEHTRRLVFINPEDARAYGNSLSLDSMP